MSSLNVFERIILLNILPVEGDFTTLKLVRQMRENLSFTEEEHKLLQFKNAGDTFADKNGETQVVGEGQIKWHEGEVSDKNINIGEKATDIIVEVLKKLSDEKKLRNEHMSVYEKFVETDK